MSLKKELVFTYLLCHKRLPLWTYTSPRRKTNTCSRCPGWLWTYVPKTITHHPRPLVTGSIWFPTDMKTTLNYLWYLRENMSQRVFWWMVKEGNFNHHYHYFQRTQKFDHTKSTRHFQTKKRIWDLRFSFSLNILYFTNRNTKILYDFVISIGSR